MRCPAPGRCGVRSNGTSASGAERPAAAWPGLILTLGDLFEEKLVHGEIGHRSFQAGIFGFQFLQAMRLIDLHPAVHLAPAVIGLIGDTDVLARLAYGFTLAEQDIGFSELVYDLFGVVSFLGHGSDLLIWLFTTLDLDQEFEARSPARMRVPYANSL